MALNSSEVLVPATSGIIYWLYESNKALNNQVDSEGYYYMSYAAASSSNSYTRYTTSTSSDNPINLYKKITSSEPDPVYYTVTFKDWNGTTLKTEQVIEGGSATAPADPTRVGYTFTGWDKAFNNVTSDLTVTAQYTINTYTVTFKDWDGTTLKTQTVNYGGSATAPTDPIRDGYTFIGWDKAFTNVTANLVVTALYEQNAPVSTLGDVNCDGTVTASDISALFAYIMNAGNISEEGYANADINGDGVVDATDASLLAQMVFGA